MTAPIPADVEKLLQEAKEQEGNRAAHRVAERQLRNLGPTLASAYVALTAENASLVRERDSYLHEHKLNLARNETLAAQLTTAQAALRTARTDALEEAAKCAESKIAEYEEEHRMWREGLGKDCAQPHEDVISERRDIAMDIRALATRDTTEN